MLVAVYFESSFLTGVVGPFANIKEAEKILFKKGYKCCGGKQIINGIIALSHYAKRIPLGIHYTENKVAIFRLKKPSSIGSTRK